jgi:hypothetical protein
VPRPRATRALLLLATCLSIGAPPAHGQRNDPCDLPERYHDPIDVALDDLAVPGAYKRRAVRVKGVVQTYPDVSGGRRYVLREGKDRVGLVPCPGVASEFDDLASRWPRLEVTGVVTGEPGAGSDAMLPSVAVLVWAFADLSPLEQPGRQSAGVALGDLLRAGDAPPGKKVVVKGQFGGRNLLGDLPAASAPEVSAWVLRDGRDAIWIVGKRPEGPGFKLDPDYAPDAARWLVVEGKLERCGAVICLRARRVSLGR